MTFETSSLFALLVDLPSQPCEERSRGIAEIGASVEDVLALADYAEAHAMTDLNASIGATKALVELADRLGSPLAAARVRRSRAHVLAYANRLDESLAFADEAVQLANQAEHWTEAARAQLTRLHAMARLGRYDQAIAAGETAYAVFEHAKDDAMLGRAAANLGVTHRMRDDPEQALRFFNEAALLLGDQPIAVAQVQSNRAEALLDLNRFADAERAFRTALEEFESADSHRAAAIVLGNLADLLSRQGRASEALDHFERAVGHFEDQAAPGDLARLKAEQADAFSSVGAWSNAVSLYRDALPLLDQHAMAWEAARARLGLGRALAHAGSIDDAKGVLAETASAFKALGHRTGAARAAMLAGELAMLQEHPSVAQADLVQAMDALEDRPADLAATCDLLARLSLRTGNFPAATAMLDRAQSALENVHASAGFASIHQTRADIAQRQGRIRQAVEHLRSAVREVERVRGSLQADQLRSHFLGSRIGVYEQLVKLLLDEQSATETAEAFHVAEQSRSRSLLDVMHGAMELIGSGSGREGDEDALLREFREQQSAVNVLYSRLNDLRYREPAELTSLYEQIRVIEQRIELLENRLAIRRGAGGLFAPPVTADRLQRLLSPTCALIAYFLASDQLAIFVLRHDRVDAVQAASRETVKNQVERLQFQVGRSLAALGSARAQRTQAELIAALRDLHQVVLGSVSPLLDGANRLFIVPHGPLHGIPFHALHDGQRFLLENCSVTSVPSASLLEHLLTQRVTSESERKCLLIGYADADAPAIDAEVSQLQQTIPGAIAITGEQATRQRILESTSGFNLVHFACHGRFSGAQPFASGLKLADGWLTIRDLYGVDLSQATVTLSGCETARAAVECGVELIGMVRSLFAAGASSLIMSLWNVQDQETQKMMAKTYSLWNNGNVNMAECLHHVQREALAANVHPAVWAPLIAIGGP